MTGHPPTLPAFIVIGAAKAATTWIVHQLQHHPDVFMPNPEPHYFSRDYARGPQWYAGFFAAAAPGQIVGEKSADYLAHPEAATRIARDVPDARLIAQLRNPIERAYSDYCMLYRRGTVRDRPEAYLRRGGEVPRFLEDGLYARHLQRFLDRFPADRIALLLHEEIRRDPEAAITRVCRHIGVAPHIAPAAVAARVNDSQAALLPLGLRRALAPLKSRVAPWRDRAFFRALHHALARPPAYPHLTDDLRQRLRDFYAADVERLSGMLGRDLSWWLADAA